jgi:hypothetical protein
MEETVQEAEKDRGTVEIMAVIAGAWPLRSHGADSFGEHF